MKHLGFRVMLWKGDFSLSGTANSAVRNLLYHTKVPACAELQHHCRDLYNLIYCKDEYIRISPLLELECWAELNFCDCTEVTGVLEHMNLVCTVISCQKTDQELFSIADMTLVLQSMYAWACVNDGIQWNGGISSCSVSLSVPWMSLRKSITKFYV